MKQPDPIDFEFRNYLNDHEAILWKKGGHIERVPFTGKVTRLDIEAEHVITISNIDIVRPVIKSVINVPPQEHGVYNIVSGMTAEYLKRPDCISPDTLFPENIIKNGRGNIEGVKRLLTYSDKVWF